MIRRINNQRHLKTKQRENHGGVVVLTNPIATNLSMKVIKPLILMSMFVCLWLPFLMLVPPTISTPITTTTTTTTSSSTLLAAPSNRPMSRRDILKHCYWTNKTQLLPQVLHNNTCPKAQTPLRSDRRLSPSVCSVYIHASPYDRSGAYVFHLLDGYAYAYHWGFHFAGACGETPHAADTRSLVSWLGLDHVLALDLTCPDFEHPNETQYYDHVLRSTDLYRKRDFYFKRPWLKFVKKQIHRHLQRQYPTQVQHKASGRTVVVHIRRGDVMPCMLGWGRMRNTRFTPNQHYLNVLDYYAQPGDVVKIYSESLSYEPWDVFLQRGYQLYLDGPLVDAWKAMIWDAHVLILSQSSFSYVPALFSRAELIVYTPQFKSNPQPSWAVVPQHIMNQTTMLRNEMLANCTYQLEKVYGNDQQEYMKHRNMYSFNSTTNSTVTLAKT